jgi:FKBP-type peptidyl-prolyl cis-trans isomerase FklB
MTRFLITAILCFCAVTGCAYKGNNKKSKETPAAAAPADMPAAASAPTRLATAEDSAGYAIGMDIARNFKRQGVEVNLEALFKAMKDIYANSPLLLSDAAAQSTIAGLQTRMQMKAAEARQGKLSVNLKKAEDFLAANKTQPGVITTASGLQYIVVKEGTGKTPLATDQVTTHYHGTLLDGTVFDSSINRGEPASFRVNGVISAWQEALQLMKEGSTYKLFCHPKLAYGESGSGQVIGPNELLVFEVQLIKVN